MPEMPTDYYKLREILVKVMSATTDYQLARKTWNIQFSTPDGITADLVKRYVSVLKANEILEETFSLEGILDDKADQTTRNKRSKRETK